MIYYPSFGPNPSMTFRQSVSAGKTPLIERKREKSFIAGIAHDVRRIFSLLQIVYRSQKHLTQRDDGLVAVAEVFFAAIARSRPCSPLRNRPAPPG